MIDLVYAHQPRGQLKHIVSQRYDDELRIFGSLFDIASDDGDLSLCQPCSSVQSLEI